MDLEYYLNFITMKDNKHSERVTVNWNKVRSLLLTNKNKGLSNFTEKNKKYNLFQKQTAMTNQNISENIQPLKCIQTKYIYMETPFTQLTPTPIYQKLIEKQHDKIDLTGNWIWQAEQVAAYFMLTEGKKYLKCENHENKILELGAGTSGLASLFFAKSLKNNMKVTVTDGKKENIEYLRMNIEQNHLEKTCIAKCFPWANEQTLLNRQNTVNRQYFNLILVCDCLFFVQYHKDLIITLDSYMNQDSIAIFVNPKRGKTSSMFLQHLCKFGFKFTILEFTDEKFLKEQQNVMNSKDFNSDEDIFQFIQIKKMQQIEKQLNV